MDVIQTLGKKKIRIKNTLIVLLALLAGMGAYGVTIRDYLFLYLGLIHLGFSVEYLYGFYRAFETAKFAGAEMTLSKKGKEACVACASVVRLREERNNFISIETDAGKKLYVHGEFDRKMGHDASGRTVNELRDLIKKHGKKAVAVDYRY